MAAIQTNHSITNIRSWDHQIHQAVVHFNNCFGLYPNIMEANTYTYNRIDIELNSGERQNNLHWSDENSTPPDEEFKSPGEFAGPEYILDFCIDNSLADMEFKLVFDSDDGDGGEEVEIEIYESEAV